MSLHDQYLVKWQLNKRVFDNRIGDQLQNPSDGKAQPIAIGNQEYYLRNSRDIRI